MDAKDYFFLKTVIEQEAAFAFTENVDAIAADLIPQLLDRSKDSFSLSLKSFRKPGQSWTTINDLTALADPWLDLQPNNLAWSLMSERLKDIIENSLTGEEYITWVALNIHCGEHSREYYMPRFAEPLDVLDFEKTKFVKGTSHIIVPCFSYPKINRFAAFSLPQLNWQIPSSIYVNTEIRRKIEKAKLTGVGFEDTKVAN